MVICARVRWIAEAPSGVRTYDRGRIWRWSERDRRELHVEDITRFRTPRDPRRAPVGLVAPGLGVFDDADRPLLALGRLPCLRDDETVEDAVLVPHAQGGWYPIGAATTTHTAQTLRDTHGSVQAVRTWPQPLRTLPVDERERICVGGVVWRLRAETLRAPGLCGWLSAPDLVGIGIDADSHPGLIVRYQDARTWRGDVDAPLVLEGGTAPDLWTLAALALATLCAVDASDGGHRD